MSKKINQDDFLYRAKLVHGDTYDYSLSVYKRKDYKVKIVCNEHGVFEQSPAKHWQGRGCPKCGRIRSRDAKIKYTTETFIEEAKKIQNVEYDYSETKYFRMGEKVKILCPKHGIFEQTPCQHLKGHGCRKCAFEYTTSLKRFGLGEFLDKCKQKHNNIYNYDLVKEYENQNTKIKIICPEHGVFEQTAGKHLNGNRCPQCSALLYNTGWNEEKYFYPYLKSITKDTFVRQYNIQKEDYTNYYVDFYFPEKNIVIEYDENSHYESKNRKKDIERQHYIENKLGCKFVRVKDKDFMKDNNCVIPLLKECINIDARRNIEDLFN